MFPEKARHWTTGPYENSFYYDSWYQWLDNAPYTKPQWLPYSFLTWNIKDSADSKTHSHTIQLIYATRDGYMYLKTAHIHVEQADEPAIRQWLKIDTIC